MTTPSSPLHVAICIVGYRNADDIVRCLAALARTDYPHFEVVICENGGPEAYAQLAAVLPEALPGGQPVTAILAPGNLGFAGGVNVCLAAAPPENAPPAGAWWILNPDTEPYPDALARLVQRLAEGDCDAVGHTLHLPSGQVQSHGGRWQPWLARAISIDHGTPLAPAPDPARIERRQNYLNGASMLVSRRFVETAGPLREDYFLYCEEVEWCLRAQRAGLTLGFAPGALVLHHQGTTTGNRGDLARKTRPPVYLNERNKLLLTRDLYPARLPLAAPATLAITLARYARRRAWRQLGYALEGWSAGLAGQRGPLT
ncbi:MAG TPA: glycosyltransferase family 2 protein [Caulobacteraceae bacterium]